jgi:hypothetical protein
MFNVNGGLSFVIFANELLEISTEKGLLAFNTTPFELFAKELPEGPEGKHWLAPSSPPLDTGA